MINDLLAGFFQGAAETINLGNPRDPAIAKMFGVGEQTPAGVSVDENKVLALPAVVRAANIVSNGIKKLPFYVFREMEDGREFDRNHPSWKVVSRKPNAEFTAGPFKKTMTYWAMLWGNGCAYIDSPNWPEGPIELIPLLPDRTFPIRINAGQVSRNPSDRGQLYYATEIAREKFKFPSDRVIHIRGLGPSPYWGHNVVEILRDTFGGALAVQEHGHRFFGQGANPAGFIEMPGGLEEEAEERFMESLKRASTGLSKAHKFAVLEEGAKFHQLTVTPEDAQFLETKQLDVRLIAMAMGVKVHKLIDGANSAFKSLEQANQEHKDDDLMPWVDTWQEELSDKLLTEDQLERGTHSIGCDDDYLEWVPFGDNAIGTEKLYNGGIIDKDEARRRMKFGPAKTPHAKSFRKPMNIGIEGEDDLAASVAGPGAAEDSERYEQVAVAFLDRTWKKTQAQMIAKAQKGIAAFAEWANNIRADDSPPALQSAMDAMFTEIREKVYDMADTKTDANIAEAVQSYCKAWSRQSTSRFLG